MKVDLSNKVAIITGAAGDIGRVTAKLMLENSARVIIADISDEEGEKAARELSAIGECMYVHADVSDRESVESLVETAVSAFKHIDILVNNAGVNVLRNRVNINEYSEEDWKWILGVDLNGVFYCSRAASPVMIRQGWGRIINIGSVLGSVPARKQVGYVAAKAAVHTLTKAMALELGPHGITVNVVSPGSTLTAGTKALFYGDEAAQGEMVKQMLSHIPLGRPGDPEDIANAVLFLAGEESKYITGHVLTVDGGWTCGYTRDF